MVVLWSQPSRVGGAGFGQPGGEGRRGDLSHPTVVHAIAIGSLPALSRQRQLPVQQRAGKDCEALKYRGKSDECGQFQADYAR